ncbi:MAG: bifunctional (p)ppGpp synthetase/guanosine-3',5'-bis(diphosphate) 3'-pyrophosphohydrolase [Fibrobacteres bacterium]|nr:bifunctional (p)ppGpp synthetase/guanosine-3',5'-bis(diphosphate) 3'-pyrophosphohydrolase [Fibrobacterota bacterium]
MEWIRENRRDLDADAIAVALDYGAAAHEGQRRKSGVPYADHPFEVARILAENEMDTPTVIAGVLHDVVEDTEIPISQIEAKFGREVAFLVEGVTKMALLPSQTREQRQAETYRKMLVSMARDPRVILIKFADRLHNLRTLRYMAPEKRKSIASETIEVYAPLAHRFGLARVKWELEDLSFKHLHPDEYQKLVEKISDKRAEREQYIRSVVEPLEKRFAQAELVADVSGRPKHLYSIWRKMREKGVTELDNIHDLNAVRVLVGDIAQCYEALGYVHGLWAPIAGRFKDYIAVPKSNLYQSLHTTVMGPEGKGVEVQIRTAEMDRIANDGIAAHWAYKQKVGKGEKVLSENRWLEQILQLQQDTRDAPEFMEMVRGDLSTQEIFVYTPRGDVVQLPKGATAVDYAFEIHTGVGMHCAGAKVDGSMTQLHLPLQSGQTVEIIRTESAHPTRDWLRFVKTSKARSGIRRYLKQTEVEADRILGREILTRELARRQIQTLSPELLSLLLDRSASDDIVDLHARLGRGEFTTQQLAGVLPALPAPPAKSGMFARVLRRKATAPARIHAILVGGHNGILHHRAGCCQPVPGEEIRGYITQGRGISLHTSHCPQGKRMIAREGREVEVCWDEEAEKFDWEVSLEVTARDRQNLLRDLTGSLSTTKANVLRADISTIGDSVRDRFRVAVHNLSQLESCMASLRGVNGVLHVMRTGTAS